MAKLTEKQKKFADYYIELGNATQAAIKAGYSKRTANRIGPQNLSKLVISEYIEIRLSELAKGRLMTVQRALEISASIAEGDPQTFIYREIDSKTDEVILEEKKQYSPKIEERQKSLEHILKVNGAFDRDKNDKAIEQSLRKLTADADIAEFKAEMIKTATDESTEDKLDELLGKISEAVNDN
ncbi:MAG: terminase small subunit [Lactococcus raffinolactis]|nr:terminase small subunit [Lactococcus raffinolactis]